MKLLYVHTAEKIKKTDEGIYYTDGAYDESVWERYIKFSNNNVTFFSTLDDKKYDDDEIKKKFNIIPSNIKIVATVNITQSIKVFLNMKLRKEQRKKIKDLVKKSDAIIIRVPCNADNIFIKYAKKFNKPYMLEVVGCIWDSLWNYNWKGKILAPIYFFKERFLIKNSKYCVYVTNKFLQKRYPTKGKNVNCSNVILNSIDEKDIEERIKKINNNNKKIVLGTCAAIDVKYKGQEDVIKVIHKLKEKGLNIEYQLIGNGNKKRLEQISEKYKVKENVKFLGSIPHIKVFNWLNKIDIYIQPSKQEGLPRALIEAMSKACPCVGTNIAGIPELIDKNCLYNKGNLKELFYRIQFLISNKEFMIKQAKYNFNVAREYEIKKVDYRRMKFYHMFKEDNNL